MRTKMTIMTLALAVLLTSIGVLVMLMLVLGAWLGLGVGVGIAAVKLLAYRSVVRPWHSRWGATELQPVVPVYRGGERRADHRPRLYRWYNDLKLPPEYGGGVIQERIDTTREDRERSFNRTEYTRAIGPSDPDFDRRYGRRNNSEQEHAWLKDALYKKRARSRGWRRQKAEMLGWGLLINALALEEHRKQMLNDAA